MRIERKVAGNVRVLGLAGEFDAPEAKKLGETLDAVASAGGAQLVLDLRNVTFASAATLDCLVRARAAARRRGGDLVLSEPPRFLKAILRALGLDRSFGVFPDDDAAISYFRAVNGRKAQGPTERTLAG